MSTKTERNTTLHTLLTAHTVHAYSDAVRTIAGNLAHQPVHTDDFEAVTTVYQLPITLDQALLLERLLAPALSDSYTCDRSVMTIVDALHNTLEQVTRLPNLGIKPLVFASVYNVRRAYGGPEEGGWYYDDWSLESTTALDADTDAELQALLDSIVSPYRYALACGESALGIAPTPQEMKATDSAYLLKELHRFLLDIPNYSARLEFDRRIRNDPDGYYLTHEGWMDRAAQTREVCLVHASHSEVSTYLVFEWHPGMRATIYRPHYC